MTYFSIKILFKLESAFYSEKMTFFDPLYQAAVQRWHELIVRNVPAAEDASDTLHTYGHCSWSFTVARALLENSPSFTVLGV